MKAKQKKEKRPAGTRVGSWLYPAVPPPAPQGGILDSLRRARWQRKRRRLSSRGSLGVHRRARWISERHIGNLIRSRQTQATSRGPRAKGRERAEGDPAAQPCRSDGYASSGTGERARAWQGAAGMAYPFGSHFQRQMTCLHPMAVSKCPVPLLAGARRVLGVSKYGGMGDCVENRRVRFRKSGCFRGWAGQ